MSRTLGLKDIKDQLVFLSKHNAWLAHEIKKIKQHEHLSEAEHNALKQKKAMDMIGYAKKHSDYYRRLYKNVDTAKPFSEIYSSLPVINKADILANRKAMCTTFPFLLKEGLTSGTSGTPLTVYRSPGSIIRENAYVWYFRMMHGLNIGDPIVSMRGKLDNKTLSYYNKTENVLYLSIYMLSAANIGKYVQLIEEFKPKAISTLPSTLYAMVNLMNEANLQFTVPMVFTASSTLYPFQREKIEATLHTKVIDWYGNAERTITLGQCAHGNYHEFPMYSYNEFKRNGVITTSLCNRSFPLIRYYVDDVFHLLDGPCACGKEKAISYIQGRFEDAVLLSDGTLVNGLGIAFQGIKHLQYAQVLQERVNAIQVNLVVAPGFSKEDEQLIAKRLRQRMNDTATIEFRFVNEEDIIKTPTGKFTLIISKLDMARLPDALRTFEKRPTEAA
jgi:phenylacetate-CoA ligase